MNKCLILLALGLSATPMLCAQKKVQSSMRVLYANNTPEKGDITAEIGFTPFKSDGESFKLNDGLLKLRYFLSDHDALRLKVGLGMDNTSTTNNSVTGETQITSKSSKTENKMFQYSVGLGYERHLPIAGRLDFYAGAEVGFGAESYSGEETTSRYQEIYKNNSSTLEYTSYDSSTKKYEDQNVDGSKQSNHYFSVSLLTGVDYYVYKSLYLGVELGLNFKNATTPNYYYTESSESKQVNGTTGKVTYKQTTNYSEKTGVKTVETVEDNKTSSQKTYGSTKDTKTTSNTLNLYVEPAIRLGWKF